MQIYSYLKVNNQFKYIQMEKENWEQEVKRLVDELDVKLDGIILCYADY